MKHAASPTEKGISLHRHSWRYVLVAGLLLSLLAVVLSLGSSAPPRTFAALRISASNGFTSSPTEGPVGAVIAVSGSNLNYDDGTQVRLGYTTTFLSKCTVIPDSQGGAVQNQSFSGWLRWPTTLGVGNYQICALVGGNHPFVGFYTVLSAAPPQIAVAPTAPNVSKQATVSGANFLPGGTSVNLLWRAANGGQALSLGTVTSDSTGAFSSTFTVPAKSSTGSYSVLATVGSGQPPTLSASTTFHVNGITIAPVPTPAAQVSPTITSSPTAVATSSSTPTGVAQSTSSSSVTGGSGLIMPIALGGFLLVVVALVAGVLVVRRQRELAAARAASGGSGPPLSGAPAMGAGGVFPSGVNQSRNGFLGRPTTKHSALSRGAATPATMQSVSTIPFDPALAEAMRQAQVSMFATPRPPVIEEVPS